MIRNKIDIVSLIDSLNELQKLKMLLFDNDQLYIFENLPKPYLLDQKLMTKLEDDSGLKEADSSFKKRISMNLNNGKIKKEILVTNNDFWKKHRDSEQQYSNLMCAFDNIKKKENLNMIDLKLLQFIDRFDLNNLE